MALQHNRDVNNGTNGALQKRKGGAFAYEAGCGFHTVLRNFSVLSESSKQRGRRSTREAAAKTCANVEKEQHRSARRSKHRKTHGKGRGGNRSESPPAKKHRDRRGRNKGCPGGCSFCRPEIHKRMYDLAATGRAVRDWKSQYRQRGGAETCITKAGREIFSGSIAGMVAHLPAQL